MANDYQVKPSAELHATLNKLARTIDNSIPKGMAFSLLLFDGTKVGSNLFYISNAAEFDVLAALQEFINRKVGRPGTLG